MEFPYDDIDSALIKYQRIMEQEEELKTTFNQQNEAPNVLDFTIADDGKESRLNDISAGITSLADQETLIESMKNQIHQPKKTETPEIGLFYTLNCDIKASDDMIKKKYLERTQELISDHLTMKINQKKKKRESREEEDGDTDRSSNQQNTENSDYNSGEDEED